jgi:hypothetical protein
MASERSDREAPANEADAAKAAIRRALAETRESLGAAVDVRLWTKKSPWIAVGLAATAGLAAAVLFRRGKNRTPVNPAVANPQAADSKPAQGGIGAAIASSLFDLAKFGLETAIMSGIREVSANNSRQSADPIETTQSAQPSNGDER